MANTLRGRRLRAYLKYARMSVAMRAEATDDAPRSQTTNVARDTVTEFFAMSEGSDVVGGGRPPSLVDVWW